MHHRPSLTLALALSAALPALASAQVYYNGRDLDVAQRRSASSWSKSESAQDGAVLILKPQGGRSAEARAMLEAAGYRILAAVPPDGYLAQVQHAESARSLARAGKVEWATMLAPEWKRSPAWRSAMPAPGSEIGLIIHAAEITAELEAALLAAGGQITTRPGDAAKARLGLTVPAERLEAVLAAACADPLVTAVEPGTGARLFNDGAAPVIQSGSVAGGRPIWERGLYGAGQVIAILDTGLDWVSCYFREADTSQPPLALGTELGVPDFSRRKVVIYNLLLPSDQDAGPGDFDNHGHGTYVGGNAAGSDFDAPLAANRNNGMAPLAQLVAQDGGHVGLDDCSDLTALGCPVIDLTPILEQAIGQGAHIHNNSWGDRENSRPQNLYTGPTADMDDATWRHPDFLIVCAAGNSGQEGNDSVASPSIGKNVLSVGATQGPGYGNSPEFLASFSSIGWAADGRIKPDVTAPGQTVTAKAGSLCLTAPVQGTSMASPVTAGAAALAREYFTAGYYPTGQRNPSHARVPSAALLKAVLINGAADMTGVPLARPNRMEGWGRVHLENALFFPEDSRRLVVEDHRTAFDSSAAPPRSITVRLGVNSASAGGMKATLVWTDPPADPAADVSLVNDLHLTVTGPGGAVWQGNVFDGPTGLSIHGGEPDTRNNVEQVVLPTDAEPGDYTITVSPALIDVPGQGFALVMTGDVLRLEPPAQSTSWMLY